MCIKFFVPAAVALTGIFLLGGAAQSAETNVAKAPKESLAAPNAPQESSADETASAEELAGDITLMQALKAALLKNPELAAFSKEIRAREGAVQQAGLLPNPVVTSRVENWGNNSIKGFEGDWGYLELSQLILLGGKREARIKTAQLTQKLADWDYEAQRITVAATVAQAFAAVLGAQARLDVARQTADIANRVVTAVSNQVKAGKVSPVEQTRAEVALATIRTELVRTERELEAARRQLAATWGGESARFSRVVGHLEAVSPIPTLEQLAERIHNNPDLARWGTELAQRQAMVSLAKTYAIPDLTAAVGITDYMTQNALGAVAEFSIPLPIVNRNQGGIREAERRRSKAIDEQRAAEVRVGTALNTAYQALAAAYVEAETYKASILPGAASAFEAVQTGYRLGKFALLDVLDTQRTLFAAKAQYLRALTAYHQAVAEVERLIGEPLVFTPASEEPQ